MKQVAITNNSERLVSATMKETLIEKSVFKNINDVIPHFGPFGRFQILLTAVFCVMIIPSTYQILIMYFGALNPEWRCAANSTVCFQNGTFAKDNMVRCNMSRSDWEFTEKPGYSIITQFDIYCDEMWIVSLATSMLFIGWGVGAVFLGWVADNYGRKIVLFPSLMIVMIVGFISSFSPNVSALIVCRFIVGFFTPGTGVQMVVLMSEFVSTEYRPLAITVIWFFFSVALCVLGLKAYFIREWKWLFIVVSAPYLFILLFYKFVPESIRWLHLHGRNNHLIKVFHRMAYWNRKTIPNDFQMLPLESRTEKHKASPLDLFRTRRMTLNTLNQGFGWLVNGMVYFGLSLAADDLGGNLYTNFILLSAVEFPANLLTIYLCERIGRKKTTSWTMALGSVACIAVAFIPVTGKIKILRVVLGVLGKCCITISFSAIYTWSLEIYPTNIRAEGMGFLQIASRIGAASSPWIAKGLKALHQVAPFIVMGSLSFLSAIALLFLPETRGKPTKDTDEEDDMNTEIDVSDDRPLTNIASDLPE